jgi:hypothetical protein
MTKLMKGLMKRRTLFATLLALTIFGAVYGFAATLNVSPSALSAGNASLPSCQGSTAPTTAYGLAYQTSPSAGYYVTSVNVSGLNAACAGKTVSVVLTDSGNASLASGSITIPAGGGTATISSLTGSAAASGVANVNVAING